MLSILYAHAAGGRIHVIEWLLGEGFTLDETNHNGDTCLLLAAYGGHLELVEWLVNRKVPLKQKNKCGFTSLLSAANGGQLNAAKWLIEHGSELTEADEDGYTPLILAACGGSIELVEYFLSLGAENTEVNNNGRHLSWPSFCATNQRAICSIPPYMAVLRTLICLACACHPVRCVNAGDTPLLLAAYCGHTKLVDWLLNHGSTLKEKNNTEMGALISAANGGNVEVVQLLLKYIEKFGPDCGDGLESTDQGGYTPLLLAAQRGHLEIVRLLATAGSDLQVRTIRFDNDAKTLSGSYPEVCAYIKKIWEWDMIDIAADAGMIDRVHELTQSASTKRLKHAAHVAEDTPHKDIQRLLRLALAPWAPSRHQLFCITHGDLVFTLLNIQNRLLTKDMLPFLPPEMWIAIASFFPRVEMTWSVSGEDPPPSPTTKLTRQRWRRKNSLCSMDDTKLPADAGALLGLDAHTNDEVKEAAHAPNAPMTTEA